MTAQNEEPVVPMNLSDETMVSRRKLLKALAATSGAVVASQILPGQWMKPVIESGLLPAHAQGSPTRTPTPIVLGTGDLQVTLTWNTGIRSGYYSDPGTVDIDLHVVEPDGTIVYFGNKQGTTTTLDVDNRVGFGPENIFSARGRAATGIYTVFLNYYRQSSLFTPTTCTVDIKVFANTAQEKTQRFTRVLSTSSEKVNVAKITFPAGLIEELTGIPTSVSTTESKDGQSRTNDNGVQSFDEVGQH